MVCLVQSAFEKNDLETARKVQAALVAPNAAVTTTYSVAGLKAALEAERGYGGKPRMPMRALEDVDRKKVVKVFRALENYEVR